MTGFEDERAPAGLAAGLDAVAKDVTVGAVPLGAILGDGRRRARTRTIGGSALGVAAVGMAVALGTTAFGGGTAPSGSAANAASGGPRTSATTTPGPAGTPQANQHPATTNPGYPMPPWLPATPTPTPVPSQPEPQPGTTVLAAGTYHGVAWQLVRDIHAATADERKLYAAGEACSAPMLVEDIYVQTADGKRDSVGGGPACTTDPKGRGAWTHDFAEGADDSWAYTPIGRGADTDPTLKDALGTAGGMLFGIARDDVARVRFFPKDGGAAQDATLIKPGHPDNGQFFYLPLPYERAGILEGTITLYDAAGNVLQHGITNWYAGGPAPDFSTPVASG